MPGSDGSVVIKIDGDDSGFERALNGIGGIAQKAGKLAATAFAGTGAALTVAAGAALRVGMNFEASMSNVAALSGATGEELALLTDTAKEMGATTQFSATQAADALAYMALAGWDAQQSVDALPGVLDLAASSGMDLAAASDMVTDYLSAFGMEAQDSTYFADMLAYAQGNANTTAAGLGEAYKNCAANMHAAGQDVETTTSLLSMLANQGLKGSEAGTALAAVMRDLTAKMEDGAIKIGDTAVKVMDANGNYRDMTDILHDVQSATEGMGDAEKAAALSGTFTSDSIKGLNMVLNAGVDEAAKFEAELRNSTGTASDMADTMNDNLKGRLTELGSALEGVGIQCYEAMEGPLKRGVESATESIGELSDEMANGRLKNSTEKIAEGFGRIVKVGGKLAQTTLPKIVNGVAEVIDQGDKVVALTGSIAAGYAAFKAAKYIEPIAKSWKAATIALEAHEAASRLTLVATYGGLTKSEMLVGVLTGKISLATAAQAAWNAVAAVNPYVLIGAAIAAAAVGIGLYISAQETEIEKAHQEAEAAAESRKAYEELLTARQNSINNSMAEIDNTELLIARFKKLTDETGRVKAGTDNYAEAKALAAQINAVAPGAIEDLEDESGAYMQVCKSVDLLIAKKRLEAMIDANQEAYNDALHNKAQAEQDYANAKKAASEARIALEKAEEEYAQHSTGSLATEYGIRLADAQDYYNELAGAEEDHRAKLSEIYQTIGDQSKMLAASESDDLTTMKNAMLEYESTIVEFTGKNAAACLQQMQDNNAVLANKKSNLAEGMAVTQEEIDAAQSAADRQTQIAAQGINNMIQAVRSRTSDAKEAQKSINDAMLDAVGELKEPLSAESAEAVAASIMRMQVEANGAETVGQNFAEGYYNGLFANLGIADDAAAQIVTSAIEAAKTAQDSHSPSRIMAEQGMYFAQGFHDGITENQDIAASPASLLVQAAIQAAQNGLPGVSTLGRSFVSFLSGGITSGKESAKIAGAGVADSAVSGARGQKGAFSTAGTTVGTSFSSGIKAAKSLATSAANSIATAGHIAASGQKNGYQTSGKNVAASFKSGISGQKSAISEVSKAIAAAGHIAANHTKATWMSVGKHLASGLSSGISNGRSTVISAAVNMARAAISAARAALGIRSPSKVAEREIGQWYVKGIAAGINRYAYTMQDAVSDAFYDMQDAVNAHTADLSVRLTGAHGRIAGSGNTMIHNEYNQTINSPKALSRREIIRETKNVARRLRTV